MTDLAKVHAGLAAMKRRNEQEIFAAIHEFRMSQREALLLSPPHVKATQRRRMLHSTSLRTPRLRGRLLHRLELQPRSPGSGVQPGGRGGSEIRAHHTPA